MNEVPLESFAILARRIRRRTLWLQDAARQEGPTTSARASVVEHIVAATQNDLGRLKLLWMNSTPEEQAQRGVEYRELSDMLKAGLECVSDTLQVSVPIDGVAVGSGDAPAGANTIALAIQEEDDEDHAKRLEDIFKNLTGLHALTQELARGVESAKTDLFSIEDCTRTALLNTEHTKKSVFEIRQTKWNNCKVAVYGTLALAAGAYCFVRFWLLG